MSLGISSARRPLTAGAIYSHATRSMASGENMNIAIDAKSETNGTNGSAASAASGASREVHTTEIEQPSRDLQDVDMIDEDDEEVDKEKIKFLPQATSDDGSCASFQITEEDHTLGNALRYIIMKNPEVEFCGYSIPHPSENLLNIRIQTYGEITAVEALQKGLQDLMDLCDAVEDKFTQRIREM